jgi:4-hydroxy 2-oxovalerate aldolase
MKPITILDCTIRDGGYYTNWDFDQDIVKTYLESFNHLPVEYLEVGYRSEAMEDYLGEYFYCPVETLQRIKNLSNKKLVIILNEKDVRASDAEALLSPIIGLVTMVRMAIDPKNFERALSLAAEVKRLGFEVAFNVMYMSTWADEKEFLELIPQVDKVADYFYMVDSFGGVYPQDVKDTIALVRSKTNVKLGFHGHNNLEMALANTLTAIDENIDIVDATVTGMGRGAGNLKTELLLTVLNAKGLLDFPYNELSKTVDDFTKLQKHYEWGTNLPYMVSGANSLPQKQVMEWVGKRYYSFNSIIRALNNQSQGKVDNTKLPELDFGKEKTYAGALIVGGGPSAKRHTQAIDRFLINNPNIIVIHASSKNALSFENIPNDQYFCLVGNEGHRLEDVFQGNTIKGKCILPPYPRKMGTYIPKSLTDSAFELKSVDFTELYKDSHTALALQSILALKIEKVFITGYDGYSGDHIGEKEQELFLENQYLFSKIRDDSEIQLLSLTPTKYTNLKGDSVYSKI